MRAGEELYVDPLLAGISDAAEVINRAENQCPADEDTETGHFAFDEERRLDDAGEGDKKTVARKDVYRKFVGEVVPEAESGGGYACEVDGHQGHAGFENRDIFTITRQSAEAEEKASEEERKPGSRPDIEGFAQRPQNYEGQCSGKSRYEKAQTAENG